MLRICKIMDKKKFDVVLIELIIYFYKHGKIKNKNNFEVSKKNIVLLKLKLQRMKL